MEDLVLSCLESRVEEARNLYARFLVGPFLKGDALTVATALRRVLLSSIESIGITALYIQGITHEFSTIVGVRESVLELSLNFQAIVLSYDKTFFQKKTFFNDLQIGYLQVQGPKVIYANDLKLPFGIRLVDPTQYIATVSKEGSIVLKFIIGKKRAFLHQNTGPESFFGNPARDLPIIGKVSKKNIVRAKKTCLYKRGSTIDWLPVQSLANQYRSSYLPNPQFLFVRTRKNADRCNPGAQSSEYKSSFPRFATNLRFVCRTCAYKSKRAIHFEGSKASHFLCNFCFAKPTFFLWKQSFPFSMRSPSWQCTDMHRNAPKVQSKAKRERKWVLQSKSYKKSKIPALFCFAPSVHFGACRCIATRGPSPLRIEAKTTSFHSRMFSRRFGSLALYPRVSRLRETNLQFVSTVQSFYKATRVLTPLGVRARMNPYKWKKKLQISSQSKAYPFILPLFKNYIALFRKKKKSIRENNVRKKKILFFKSNESVFKSDICLRNVIPLDFTLTPVLKVNFVVEIDDEVLYLRQKVRERIILEVWTNGSIHPRQAVHDAALSLTDIFASFRSVYGAKS